MHIYSISGISNPGVLPLLAANRTKPSPWTILVAQTAVTVHDHESTGVRACMTMRRAGRPRSSASAAYRASFSRI
jgi:hypothetical protein